MEQSILGSVCKDVVHCHVGVDFRNPEIIVSVGV